MSLLLLLLSGGMPPPLLPDWARAYAERVLHLTDYRFAPIDLDGDGKSEVLIYAQGPDCGSGGCDLYVLARRGKRVRLAGDISVSRPPIRLLPSRTKGWHDIGVLVAGGGILPGYTARLRYDGQRYPRNPTVPPAEPVRRPAGQIVIDALPLRPHQLAR